MELKSAKLRNGAVTFHKKVDPTSEQAGQSPHFDVSFMVEALFEGSGLEATNIFQWNVVTPERDDHTSYRSVEDRAARLIAPMLRAVADKIEADLPDFQDRKSE